MSSEHTIEQVIEAHGVEVNRNGYILCPNHDDNHPSCKVNEDFVYCFTCGWSADEAGLEAKLSDRPVEDVLRAWSKGAPSWRQNSGKVKQRVPKHVQRVNLYTDWVARSQNMTLDVLAEIPVWFHEAAKEQAWDIYDSVSEIWKHASPFELTEKVRHAVQEMRDWAEYWLRASE